MVRIQVLEVIQQLAEVLELIAEVLMGVLVVLEVVLEMQQQAIEQGGLVLQDKDLKVVMGPFQVVLTEREEVGGVLEDLVKIVYLLLKQVMVE
jgi:hypothetical protein